MEKYNKVFRFVNDFLGLDARNDFLFISDFEDNFFTAAATKLIFTPGRYQGCYFHYTQILRKLLKSTFGRRPSREQCLIYYYVLLGLPFLTEYQASDFCCCINQIKKYTDAKDLLEGFYSRFVARKGLARWHIASKPDYQKIITDNGLESYNNTFASYFTRAYLSLENLARTIKKIESYFQNLYKYRQPSQGKLPTNLNFKSKCLKPEETIMFIRALIGILVSNAEHIGETLNRVLFERIVPVDLTEEPVPELTIDDIKFVDPISDDANELEIEKSAKAEMNPGFKAMNKKKLGENPGKRKKEKQTCAKNCSSLSIIPERKLFIRINWSFWKYSESITIYAKFVSLLRSNRAF